MTNTEQLTESLERLEQMRIAFKTGNVATLGGVEGLIAELLKVLRILIEEREKTSHALSYTSSVLELLADGKPTIDIEVSHAVDKAASKVPFVERFAPKQSAKGKDAGRAPRRPVNGSPSQR